MDTWEELLRWATPSALLAPDGTIRSLNAPMAAALGRPEKQCVGHHFPGLLPESQRASAESLLTHGATTKTVAMRVLMFSAPDRASVLSLIEARPLIDPTGHERLVWVHSVDAHNDPGGLLIPFRLAATAAGLGVCTYAPQERQLEWLGGAPALASLFPHSSTSLSQAVRRVHPDDRQALTRLIRSPADRSTWTSLRFRTESDGWRHLACQKRRIQVGYGAPEQVFGVIRDDTQLEASRQQALDTLFAERQRADEIAAFSAALITAATEQELQQVVLTRVAATFGGKGAILTLFDNETGLLHASSDARSDPQHTDAMEGLSLDEPQPLTCAIRTGTPHFIPNHKDSYATGRSQRVFRGSAPSPPYRSSP
ncbi:PAS domain-containing protein [Streptomyces spinosirectus]